MYFCTVEFYEIEYKTLLMWQLICEFFFSEYNDATPAAACAIQGPDLWGAWRRLDQTEAWKRRLWHLLLL